LIGGQVFAGATRQYQIASGYATAIFNGDLVTRTTDGTIISGNAFTSAGPSTGWCGVFVGCQFVNAQGQVIFSQAYPAATTAPSGTVITAYVSDDPDTLFKVAVCSATTTVGYLTATARGANGILIPNVGVVASGDSQYAISDGVGVTQTYPFRIVDLVPETAYVVSGETRFPEAIVKFNAPTFDGDGVASGGSFYYNPLGVA